MPPRRWSARTPARAGEFFFVGSLLTHRLTLTLARLPWTVAAVAHRDCHISKRGPPARHEAIHRVPGQLRRRADGQHQATGPGPEPAPIFGHGISPVIDDLAHERAHDHRAPSAPLVH